MTKFIYSRHPKRIISLILLIFIASCVVYISLFSLSANVTQKLIYWSYGNPNDHHSLVEEVNSLEIFKKPLTNLIEHSLIENVIDRRFTDGSTGDIEKIKERLVYLKSLFLSSYQTDHVPDSIPSILSGVGYCDQLNGVAAHLLAQVFERSELFALYDPVNRTSPHTVGRVWSEEEKQWIYFDIWTEETIIFTIKGDEVVIRSRVSDIFKPQLRPNPYPAEEWYGFTKDGFVLTEYSSTFALCLLKKLKRQAHIYYSSFSLLQNIVPKPGSDHSIIRKTFLQARVNQILGNMKEAQRQYSKVLLYTPDETGRESSYYWQASSIFAKRLESAN
jgi:hypothetical protein